MWTCEWNRSRQNPSNFSLWPCCKTYDPATNQLQILEQKAKHQASDPSPCRRPCYTVHATQIVKHKLSASKAAWCWRKGRMVAMASAVHKVKPKVNSRPISLRTASHTRARGGKETHFRGLTVGPWGGPRAKPLEGLRTPSAKARPPKQRPRSSWPQ